MGARGFILMLLLFAVVGAGAGYGAAQLVPMEEEEAEPVTAEIVAPGAGGADASADAGAGTGRARQSGGQRPTVDDVIAAMPQEAQQQLENDPEAAAMARAQIQAGIDSGQITQETLGLMFGGAPAAGADPGTEDAGARNATPLSGTVVAFEGGTLRLETPDGEAAIAVPDDAPVNVTKAVSDAGAYLVEGAEVSVVARPDDAGGLAAATVVVGGAGQGAGGRGFGGLAAVVMGTVASFADGVLTLETADGPAEFALADDTPVRITTTAAEAASELASGVTVTAFVQREADGNLSAASVSVGGGGGGFGRGLLGSGQGGRQRGGGAGGQEDGESGG